MEADTLYYTFSTIPQVLGALVAILAAFVHFRIIRLQEYLIGDGKAAINRWQTLGFRLSEKQKKRLIDAVDRKNIYEIKDVLRKLSDKEKREGLTKIDRPTGQQYVYEDRFCGTFNRIKTLKISTIIASGFAIFTITSSLICLSLIDQIIKGCSTTHLTIIINLSLSVITLAISFYILYMGLTDNTKHETDRDN
jgi:hypothetical protein